ncbi:MAG: toll/interleukin-1 receptor domain-containing protein [Clostridia bacterium]|nr:toll/interleukin-1 receptor domain-containing protein [Clostridia bacterium]
MKHQIFISYRRSTGENLAHLLYYRLQNDGYNVFYDIEEMRSGKFNEQLYEKIEECEDFLLVLSENALDRCSNENDWVRLEIEEAIRLKKNIVLIRGRGFKFPEHLPKSIDEIRRFQAITASNEFFDSVISKLEGMFKSQKSISSEGRSVPDIKSKMEQLYSVTASYREAFKKGDVKAINEDTKKLAELLQELYYFCEKNKYSKVNSSIVEVGYYIIERYNNYVGYYNQFVNSSNRMSETAQLYALKAETEFKEFVNHLARMIAMFE